MESAAMHRFIATPLSMPLNWGLRHAVEPLLTQLVANPALVIDRYWNTLRMNAGVQLAPANS